MPTMSSMDPMGGRMAGLPPPPPSNGERCAQCNIMGVPLLACDDGDDNSRSNKSSPNSSGTKLRYCNNCMIGKKVKVFWPVDERWYAGTVEEYDDNTGEHLLRYHDGDSEWVKIGETMTSQQHSGNNNNQDPSMTSIPASDSLDSYKGVAGDGMSMGGDGPGTGLMGDRKWPGGVGGDPYYGGGAAGPFGYAPPPSMGYGSMPPHVSPYGVYPPPQHHYGSAAMPGPGGGGAAGQSMFHQVPPPQPHYGGGPPSVEEKSGEAEGGSSKRKTGPKAWTKEEDALLLNIVHSMQWPMKWTIVAQSLPERTGKQCRERYVNHLNPRLKVTDWTPVEDATIFHLYNTMGSHWAKMSKVIPGRTDNGIKNRFHNIRRQYEREDEHRLRLSSVEDFPEEVRLDRLRSFPEGMIGKSTDLWDMKSAVGVLAAQSVLGSNVSRNNTRFGPFRAAQPGDLCVRCGFLIPSVQTGSEVCSKTGWCHSCTRIPPHVSGHLLRECLNLRREQDKGKRHIIESWEEVFPSQGNKSSKTTEVAS